MTIQFHCHISVYFVTGLLSSLKIKSYSIFHYTTLQYSPSKVYTNIDYEEEEDGDYENSTMVFFIDDSIYTYIHTYIHIHK